jgi:outer membrane protein OmpA-like peptidoglycan-associated protein
MSFKNIMQKVFYILALLMLIAIKPSYSQTGMAAVPFLNIEPDARSSALGLTGVTQLGGANVSYWNPSLLAHQKRGIVSFSHSNWLPSLGVGIYYDHLSVSTNLGDNRGVALDVTYFNLGKQTARDEQGANLGTFGNNEFAVRIAYGHAVSKRWSLGFAGQYFRSDLANGYQVQGESINPASGLALDFSGYYSRPINLLQSLNEHINIGYNLSSFGQGIKYTDSQNLHALPTKLRLGWSYEFVYGIHTRHRFVLTNEYSKRLSRMENEFKNGQNNYQAMNPFAALYKSWSPVQVSYNSESREINTLEQIGVGIGAEYWFDELVALRGGYFHENRLNGDRRLFTLGTGVRFNRFGVDFSYMNTVQKKHPLANTMKVTVIVDFDSPKRTKTQKAEYLAPVFVPIDTVFVLLSKGYEPVRIPESTSSGEYEYKVVNERVATLTADNQLKLNEVGTTRIEITQKAVYPHTQGNAQYVMVVLPDLQLPIWAPLDTVYTYLSMGMESVQYPKSDSQSPFDFTIIDREIAQKGDDGQITLLNIGSTLIEVYQPSNDDYMERSESYVMVVLPDPTFKFEDVNFDFDKDTIRQEDQIKLDKVIDVLLNYQFVKIRLEGHTDDFGTREYNLDLSNRRTESVLKYILDRGISTDRIITDGFAFDIPKVDNDSPVNRRINRRVEIVQIK